MSVLVSNDCGVQTILPLGVECSVEDATSPISLDGTVYLNITGGSSPYSVTWSNSSNALNLYSVSAGTYTAIVVDFYGDYTATTTCTVGTKQFFVDYFADCGNEYNLYLTGFTDTVEEGKVYRFNENTGCWTYSGKTLNGINTLTSDTITLGPYDTCEECDPPVIPPYYPNLLCLSTQNPFTQYEFEFFGFYNLRPTYTGTSANALNFTIEWTTGGTINQWEVKNKPGNTLVNINDTYNPLGGWVLNGTQQTWIAVSGACPPIPQLAATSSTSDPNCENTCNGSSAVVTASGGIPPYTYSFDNGPTTPLPSVTSLCPGNHTYTVTDSSGNTFNGSFVINKGKKVTTYTLSIETTNENTSTNYGTKVGAKMNYKLKVTPPLPTGIEISVPLNFSIVRKTSTPGQTTVTYTPSLFSGSTSVSPTSNVLVSSGITKYGFYTQYFPYNYTSFTHNVNYSNIIIKNGVTVSGDIDTLITKISDGNPRNCNCITWEVENTANVTRKFHYKDCTGGTTNNVELASKQKVNFCACNVGAGSTSASTTDGVGIIISTPLGDTLGCSSTITDGNITVVPSIGAVTINDSCTSIVIQGSSSKLYSTLYQFGGPLPI